VIILSTIHERRTNSTTYYSMGEVLDLLTLAESRITYSMAVYKPDDTVDIKSHNERVRDAIASTKREVLGC
jgi:hypothetical protein